MIDSPEIISSSVWVYHGPINNLPSLTSFLTNSNLSGINLIYSSNILIWPSNKYLLTSPLSSALITSSIWYINCIIVSFAVKYHS